MSFLPKLYGSISSENSSTSLLTASSTFTGTSTFTNTANFDTININITTDQSSSTNGLQLQFSNNNTNWDNIKSYTITVSTPGTSTSTTYNINIEGSYFRVVYTNGGTNQGVFRLQTTLQAQSSTTRELYPLIEGKCNIPKRVPSSTSDSLCVNVTGNKSVYNDLTLEKFIPLVEFNGVYGINTNYIITNVLNSGVVTSINQQIVMTTTTTSGSSASITTENFVKCVSGSGLVARFSVIFTTGISGNNQIAGCGDAVNGYFFGYNDTTFGILYRSNSVDVWIPQINWNIDTMNGDGNYINQSGGKLNPSTGNIFQITLGYDGFNDVIFSIYDSMSEMFIPVHTIEYNGITPIITSSSFRLLYQTINTATTVSGVDLITASGGVFMELKQKMGVKYGRSISKTTPGTAELNLLTLRNNTTINTITNKSIISLDSLNFGITNTGNGSSFANTITINLILNPTVGGTPSFVNTDSVNSLSAIDTAGTTITGGTIIQSFSDGYVNSSTVDIGMQNIILNPGDIITVSALCTGSNGNTVVVCSLNWVEHI